MSLAPSGAVPRRGFLFRLSQGAAGLGALFIDTSRARAAVTSVGAAEGDNPDAWMKRLTGENKVMIHVHQHFISAVIDARTMLANARDAYGVPESENSIAVLTHGAAIQGLFRDDVWERFALGAHYKINDPKTGAAATRNIFLTPLDGEPSDATVPDLIKRGVTFVACNVALKTLSKRLARDEGSPETVYEQLRSGLVPGVFVVPDLFVSIQRAQKRGVAYIFTDRPR